MNWKSSLSIFAPAQTSRNRVIELNAISILCSNPGFGIRCQNPSVFNLGNGNAMLVFDPTGMMLE